MAFSVYLSMAISRSLSGLYLSILVSLFILIISWLFCFLSFFIRGMMYLLSYSYCLRGLLCL